MPQFIASARAWLAAIDPAAPAAALVLTVFLTVYLVRRFAPNAWLAITSYVPLATQIDPSPVLAAIGKLLQALPGALYGAAVSALMQGLSVTSALQGVGAGFLAAVVHEVMANYQGKVSRKLPPASPSSSSGSARSPLAAVPPSNPPAALRGLAMACIALVLLIPGCGLFAAVGPVLAEAAVVISDAVNAVDAAEALLPNLHLAADEQAKAEQLIARARQALAAAAAADDGAKDLSEEQLDASLADFRAAWADLQSAFASKAKVGLCEGCFFLPEPLAVKRVRK